MENRTNWFFVIDENTDPGAIVLFAIGLLCVLGNLLVITNIVFNSRYRKTSLSILCHHCFLDFIKALYCFPYGYSLLTAMEIPYCHLVGSSYVFVMTTSSYNLLALVVNEEYSLRRNSHSAPETRSMSRLSFRSESLQITGSNDKTFGLKSKGSPGSDRNCIFFGIFIIWFLSFLLNLGVAIIPSNTTYIAEIGNCIFLYGVPDGFVLHVLWVTLVTMAIVLASLSFFQMYRRIVLLTKTAKWRYIHDSLSREIELRSTITGKPEDETRNVTDDLLQVSRSDLQFHMRRVLIYIAMLASFALFWYPLFLLTLFDPKFQEPSGLYKILSIVAWCQPVTTPLFGALILRDLKIRQSLIKEISSNTLPLLPTQRTGLTEESYEETIFVSRAESAYDHEIIVNMDASPSDHRLQQGLAEEEVEMSPRRLQAYRMSQV